MGEITRSLMQPIYNEINPGEIELAAQNNQLIEENRLLNEKMSEISFLYKTSVQQNDALLQMLGKNEEEDEKFVDGAADAYKALEEKNALLQMEIISLKNHKDESSAAGEENVKSLQERIVRLDEVKELQKTEIELQKKENERLVNNEDTYMQFLEEEIRILKYCVSHGLFRMYQNRDSEVLVKHLEIHSKLAKK